MARRDGDEPDLPDLDRTEREALHEVELAAEWLKRAHGSLVAFHHNTGHAMDHLADAEEALRAAGYDGLADEIRDECLPAGVDGDRWSYDLLESFEAGLLADVEAFADRTREDVADGHSHVAERQQEQAWKERRRP